MPLFLFNTLTRKTEEFRPMDPSGRTVTMYCCGPTVYDSAHIGNFRAFVSQDLLRRRLEAHGWEVRHVMNITDVEDKIIRAIHASGEPLETFTRRHEKAFLDDFDALGCRRPAVMPRATEHIAEILALVKRLEDRGAAYATPDGSVYFSIERFPGYGKLSRLDRAQLKPGARVNADEHAREAYGDFALWKAWSARDGVVAWESPWGRGRPGWHIECSCMSMKHLGETLDLHCGGEDLVFPHHEDEIAQSEAATGRPFVRFWVHNAHLLVNGQKMSKSAGNFFTARDLFARGYTGRELRYVLLSAHYRLPLNFTLEGLDAARQALARLDAWEARLGAAAGAAALPAPGGALWKEFGAALDDDLNISAALGALFEALRASNRSLDEGQTTAAEAARALSDWLAVREALGLPAPPLAEAPSDVEALARERQTARAVKDWKRSDALRAEIAKRGWAVKDATDGFRLTRQP
ncbi:MAG: cysteine--tRNA ligase [Verrucomicrobiae bacterium]|nr:cysteine--tRNA ligase [Verrucomicrobiae bacterium]